MKRLLFFLLTAVSVVACSSDDNTSTKVSDNQLVVKSNKSEVEVGGYVKFSITLDNKPETAAELFIEDKQIYTPHMFEQEGTYQVVAKKKGCKDSYPLEIVVKKGVGTSLVLSIENKVVTLGDKVTFVVKDNKGNLVNGAKIYNKETGEQINGFNFTVNSVGRYVFIAKAAGYKESQELAIDIKPTFTVNNKAYPIDFFGLTVEITNVQDAKGNTKLVDKVSFFRDGTPANEYAFNIISLDGEDFNFLSLTVLVENPSIVMDGVEVLDYGQRVLPSSNTRIELSEVYVVTESFFIVEAEDGITKGTLGDYVLRINDLEIPNNGIGVGSDGVESNVDLKFDYKSEVNSIRIDFKGNFFFMENAPKDQKQLFEFLKLKL